MITFILAGNKRQAALWAAAHHMSENQWRYIESAEMVQGILPGSDVVKVGSWYARWDATIVEEQLVLSKLRVR